MAFDDLSAPALYSKDRADSRDGAGKRLSSFGAPAAQKRMRSHSVDGGKIAGEGIGNPSPSAMSKISEGARTALDPEFQRVLQEKSATRRFMEPTATPESSPPGKAQQPHEEQKEQDSPMPAVGSEEAAGSAETGSGKKRTDAAGAPFPAYMQTRRGGENRYYRESPRTDDEIEDEVDSKLKARNAEGGAAASESPE